MIQSETLLILGAGASYDYGLPLGPDLTKEAIGFLNSNQESYYVEELERTIDRSGFANLAQVIENSRTPTIDAFIEKNTKYADLLKSAITGVVLNHENRVISERKFPDRDWISWLYHTRLGSSPDSFQLNRLSFLSFNYDRIPAGLLARFMANTYETDVIESLKIVESGYQSISNAGDHFAVPRFVYVHGHLNAPFEYWRSTSQRGQVDKKMLQTVDPLTVKSAVYFERVSDGIITMSESYANQKKQRSVADNIEAQLKSAKRIYLLGMGYHEVNLRKIGFDKHFCTHLAPHLEFFGGTGVGVNGMERDRVQKLMGPHFELGDSQQDCLSFLQDNLV